MNVDLSRDWLQTDLLVRWVMTSKSHILSPATKVYRWIYLKLPAYQIPSTESLQAKYQKVPKKYQHVSKSTTMY